LSHNCSKELVDFIYFRTWLPEDNNAGNYVEHGDSNGNCRVSNGEYLCTTILSEPKTDQNRDSGNDDAWLLPSEYNDGDYPWWYSYNVYFKGDDLIIDSQPDAEIPESETGDPNLGSGSPGDLPSPISDCPLEDIKAAVIPPLFYTVLNSGISPVEIDTEFGFGCIKFDDEFLQGGGPPVLERLETYRARFHYYGFKWTVSNGIEKRVYQLQPFDATTDVPEGAIGEYQENETWFSFLSDLAVHS
jgi:hypothetical protein